MKLKVLHILFILFLLADFSYSFIQFYHTPLDGDMPGGILPAEDVQLVLNNPLGEKAILENATYPNPNKFFSHFTFYHYFNVMPKILNAYFNPLITPFLSSALAKLIMQLLLIYLLSFLLTGKYRPSSFQFILATVLITPLFQTNGYKIYMGIIDPSVTYAFFYALPLAFLLIYFAPFFNKIQHANNITFSGVHFIFFIPMSFVVCLSGPLNPGIVVIVCILYFFYILKTSLKKNDYTKDSFYNRLKSIDIPYRILFFFMPVLVLSLYSLYLGSHNSINTVNHVSLLELYKKLPTGVYYIYTQKLGQPLLLLVVLFNIFLLNKYYHQKPEAKKTRTIINWVLLFCVLYIILLPLGGYRIYRENVLRYDTFMPVTICMIFVYAKSTLFFLVNSNTSIKRWYWLLPLSLFLLYTIADEPELNKSDCQRKAFMALSTSKDSIIKLDACCTVLTWNKIDNPAASASAVELLYRWEIIPDNNRRFYQVCNE